MKMKIQQVMNHLTYLWANTNDCIAIPSASSVARRCGIASVVSSFSLIVFTAGRVIT